MTDFGDFKTAPPAPPKADTQAGKILAALLDGRRVSPRQALDEFGCFRLAARIYDLRRAGHQIHDGLVTVHGKTWTVYWITPTPAGTGQLFE